MKREELKAAMTHAIHLEFDDVLLEAECEEAAEAALLAIESSGLKLMAREPTDRMMLGAMNAVGEGKGVLDLLRAAFDAAPSFKEE